MKYPTSVDQATLDRLATKYVVQPNGCWEWRAARTTAGYGHFHYQGDYYQAHRFVYSVLRGPVTTVAMDHLCRNRGCVNPDHLEPVSHRENIRRGKTARLNPARVALIHELHDRGFSTRQIGRLLTVDHSTVSRVLNGHRWPEYQPRQGEEAA